MYQIGDMMVFEFEDSIPVEQHILLSSLESYLTFCRERRNMQDMAMLLLHGGSKEAYEHLHQQENLVSALAQQIEKDLQRYQSPVLLQGPNMML